MQGVAAPGLHVYTEPVLMPFEPAIRRLMRHATWPRGPAEESGIPPSQFEDSLRLTLLFTGQR